MKQSFLARWVALATVIVTAAGCTMKKQEAPGLSGPSEFAQSITVTLSPDILQQDGASQSLVTINARGPNGEPLGNLPLRAEIIVSGTPADFGTLSSRNVVTGPDGRATLVYTAPPATQGMIAVDEFTIVDIGVTPLGGDFGNSATRYASLRLVPRGIIVPPDGLRPSFTFSPETPVANDSVLFDASGSTAPGNNPIAEYRWDFGDGDKSTGRTTAHAFDDPGTFVVTLTVVDGLGRSRSTSQTVTVSPGPAPVARFTSSPTEPQPGQQVFFNGISSTAAPGRRIVKYTWDFGDGTSGSGAQVSHVYPRPGIYTVTLTVTDDAGRTHSATGTVSYGVEEDDEAIRAPAGW